MADEVRVPACRRSSLAIQVDSTFHLRKRRCLAGALRVREIARDVPGVAHYSERELHARTHILIKEDAGEAPADIARCAVAEGKGDVGVRAGHGAEQRRPSLPDAEGGLAA